MQTRVDVAKAGLVFVAKDGEKQSPAALDRFKKATGANTSLTLTRQEAGHFGELLVAAKEYPQAIEVYTALGQSAPANPLVQADANYGLGSIYLAQGDTAKAAEYFTNLKTATWHPHFLAAQNAL